MYSKDNLALDFEQGVQRWDRARWISVFSSHNPTIREVTECLGLGLSASSSTTNRGIPKFDNPDYRKLSSEVTKLSKELPKERDALLDFAADPESLDKELEELLGTYGPAIWSRDADRTCLLAPDPSKKTYNQDLVYEIPEHKEILKIHLHRWIIIKACYYIRNMKLKRPSGANEYDSITDIDGEGHSPNGTLYSLTPPERGASLGADFSVKPVNLKKRKSSTHLSLSDGEDAYPVKRAFSTMPISRNGSPRKPLKSIFPMGVAGPEKLPSLSSHVHHLSPTPVIVSEAGRVQTISLSDTGNSRAMKQSPTPVSFTAINTTGFTPVNHTPSDREPLREAPRTASKELQEGSPMSRTRTTHSYTSPYDPTSRVSEASARSLESKPFLPTKNASPPTQRSHPSEPGHVTKGVNGTSVWQPPFMSHAQHIYSAPQPQSLPPPSSHFKNAVHSNAQPHTSPYGHAAAPLHNQTPSQLSTHSNSRTNTPIPYANRSIAPQPPSRAGTPLAQAAENQPTKAPNTQALPLPSAHGATQYDVQILSTHDPVAASRDRRASAVQASHGPPHGHPQNQPPHQPVLKSHGPHVQTIHATQVVHRPLVQTHDIRLLQCEVTAGLMTFFYPRSVAPSDEPSLLQRLHTLWYHGEALFRAELGPHFDLISKILTSWLHERQAITALRHSLASQPGVSPVGLVDRLLAMNDLRVMRLKWKNMSTVDGLSPEDLLCQAFRVMTNTEGSEYLFKDGLERLNDGLLEFLRSEDAKIVMQRR